MGMWRRAGILGGVAALAASVLSVAPPADRATAVQPPAAWATICPGRAATAGTPLVVGAANCRWITSGGLTRRYVVYVPSSASAAAPSPLVMMLHGSSGTGEQFYNTSGWVPVAEAEGAIAVFPTGMKYLVLDSGRRNTKWHSYNLPCDVGPRPQSWPAAASYPADDVGFFDDVLADIDATAPGGVDDARRYMSGFSNGSQMTHRIAVERADTYAAAASFGAGGVRECLDGNGVPYADIVAPHLQTPATSAIPLALGIGSRDDRLLEALNAARAANGLAPLTEIPVEMATLSSPASESLLGGSVDAMGLEWTAPAEIDVEDWAGIAWLPNWQPPVTVSGRWETPQAGNTAGNTFTVMLLGGVGHRWPNASPNRNGTIRPSGSVNAAVLFWQFFERYSG